MLAQSFGTIGPVVSEEIESKKAAEKKQEPKGHTNELVKRLNQI